MLREYQQRTIDQLYAWFEAGGLGNPCLVLPTGAGKSHIVAALCKDALQNWPETRVLMLTHVKELIEQNAEKMRQHWPGAPMGIYSASVGKRQLGEPITFAGIQSVRSKSERLGHIDLVIIDECFVAGTKVLTTTGHKNIDLVRCGDHVCNAIGVGEVVAVSCKPAAETYLLEFSDGTSTECTGNHPWFTESGWKTTRELEIGAHFFGVEGMRSLWESVHSLDQAQPRNERNHFSMPRAEMEQAIGLLSVLLEENQESNEQSSISIEDAGKAKRDQAQAYSAWRQRAIAAAASAGSFACAWRGMGSGIGNTYKNAESWNRFSNLLQSGFGKPINEASHRSRRWKSWVNEKKGTRFEENSISDFPRLERITLIKRDGATPVFNIQVSGHPSYFADGKLVHNCHLVNHKDQGGYRKLLDELKAINPYLRVIGLTATPYRLGHGLITEKPALFDDLIEPVSIEELIFKGYLATLRSKVTKAKLDTSGVHKRGGEFIESELQAAVDTDDNNQKVVREIINLAGDRKAWLVFCTGVKHAHNVAEVLRQQGVTAECVTGETPKKERERLLVEFKAGRLRALTNANVLTTGFDYPDIDLIAMLRPTMSPSLYVQMAGRGMRVKSHTDHCVVLDFAGVVATHGPITAVQPPKKAGDGNGEAPVKVCDNCGELCAIAVDTCPACGHKFPEPDRKKLELRNDDIMGLEGIRFDVTSWSWRKRISRASGKAMLSCTYYGVLSDKPITEYFAVLHGGDAGDIAMRKLVTIATSSGANLAEAARMELGEESLEYLATQMSNSKHPSSIEYRMNGNFHQVIKRSWQ